jgi:hypothetical protein
MVAWIWVKNSSEKLSTKTLITSIINVLGKT